MWTAVVVLPTPPLNPATVIIIGRFLIDVVTVFQLFDFVYFRIGEIEKRGR